MIVASFLVKSLMLDWRECRLSCHLVWRSSDFSGLGERYFMETFVDGDMAANNGGWQWTASVSRAGSRACVPG